MRASLASVLAAAAMTAAAAPASAGSFGCSSSAGRLTVLGQAVEPVRAVSGATACGSETRALTSPDLGPGVGASTLVAATEVYPAQQSVLASGGVADLRVRSLPDLPITLPAPAVPDAARSAIAAARSTTVDLSGVKALIPTLPTNLVTTLTTTLATSFPFVVGVTSFNLPTNLPTNLPENLPTSLAEVDPAIAAANLQTVDANEKNHAANLANDAANKANQTLNAFGVIDLAEVADVTLAIADATAKDAAANTANGAANVSNGLANAANGQANIVLDGLRNAIPGSVGIDGASGLDSLLSALLPSGKLPDLELLHVKGAMAYANGSCQSDSPVVGGSSVVSGIDVLGQSVTGQVVDRVLGLIDAGTIDPSDVALPGLDLGLSSAQRSLIGSIPAANTLLTSVVDAARGTIRSALDALAPVKVLDPTTAQVEVSPGGQVKTATGVVQQALKVTVTIAGQTLVDGVLGEARTSSAGVDCSQPVVDAAKDTVAGEVPQGTVNLPGFQAPIDTSTPEGAALQCSKRRLVLVDVLERNGRVRLNGVADPALAGRTVSIVFGASGRTVARARIARDGAFTTTAPLPPAGVRDTNAARYTARLGREESTNLKLRRRMVIDSMKAIGRRVTITGRVLPPLAAPLQAISVVRRVTCTQEKVERRIHPRPDGRFSVTVLAPKGLGTAVYRLITKVRFSDTGTGLFTTYTLPRAVDLG